MACIEFSIPLPSFSNPKVERMVLFSWCMRVLKLSELVKGTLGIPWGMKWIFSLLMSYDSERIWIAFFAMTIIAELFSQMDFVIRSIAVSGVGKMEWKVVTTGFSRRLRKGIRWFPYSPPKIPNSCWMQISFMFLFLFICSAFVM